MRHLHRLFSFLAILALMLVAFPAGSARAISTTVVISQVYGGVLGCPRRSEVVLNARADPPTQQFEDVRCLQIPSCVAPVRVGIS